MKEKKEEKKIVTFKVFDMPLELFKEYIMYAKLYFDNQMWKVLKHGMKLIKTEEERKKTEYDNRLTILEDRMAKVEQTVYQDNGWDEKRNPKTLGKR